MEELKAYKKILHFILYVFVKILFAFPTAYMFAWSCDALFDTVMLDNYWDVFITFVITLPLLKGQLTRFKDVKGE